MAEDSSWWRTWCSRACWACWRRRRVGVGGWAFSASRWLWICSVSVFRFFLIVCRVCCGLLVCFWPCRPEGVVCGQVWAAWELETQPLSPRLPPLPATSRCRLGGIVACWEASRPPVVVVVAGWGVFIFFLTIIIRSPISSI